jgi:peptidoglycan/xylan/chitin deacetylase (PgdA/CDA1 family)
VVKRFLSRWEPRAVVLLYHRVQAGFADPQLLCVHPERFSQHLLALRERFNVVPLREIGRQVREGRVTPRTVAVTFDDGYADNATIAAPALEQARVPATMFVTTGMIGAVHEFWWDELEQLILENPRQLPSPLMLRVSGREWTWPVHTADDRRRTYDALHPILRALPPDSIDAVLKQLRAWAGVDSGRATHLAMTESQLRQMATSSYVEIGAHAVDHAVLSVQTVSEQRRQLSESRRALQKLTNKPVTAFSYPFGAPGDYTDETVGLVQEVGFDVACANRHGAVDRHASRFELPRVIVRDWDQATFARELEKAFRT